MNSPSALLRRHGLRPKRSWGQNFLSNERALQRIVEALELKPTDVVVELGAGLGHLTRALAATGAQVVAVERDRDLVPLLQAEPLPNLQVVAGNAAKINFAQTAGTKRVALVGNLPFHLTSPILIQVLEQREVLSRAVFTVQKEVADRLCAPPKGRDYGILSVVLGLYFHTEALFHLSGDLFYPAPKVDCTVVRLTPRPAPLASVSSELSFRRLVKAAFAQRRKTLFNSLKSAHLTPSTEALKDALARAKIDPNRRAETLSIEEFAALEAALS